MSDPKIPTKLPVKGFAKARRAREVLRERELQILEEYMVTLKQAAASGKFAEALEGYRWLLDHMPANEEGERLVDPSVDKNKQIDTGVKGPVINIGFKLGGTGETQKVIHGETISDDD